MDGSSQVADILSRQPFPMEGTYILNHDPKLDPESKVAGIVNEFGVMPFIRELSNEIAAVYTEPGVARANRDNIFATVGGDSGYATAEIMMAASSDYTVYKHIGSDPDRRAKGLPTVWGTMFCLESATNKMRLICGAGYLTMLRTAATTAVVINKLKPELETLSVIGAGDQGISHAVAIAASSPNLKRVLLKDIDLNRALKGGRALQSIVDRELTQEVAVEIAENTLEDDSEIRSESDVIVTATLGLPYKPPVLLPTDLKSGSVIAAIGADMVGKRELDPAIYDKARFVTDELRQSLQEGELQHVAKRIGVAQEDIEQRNSSSFHGSLLGGRIIGITELLADPTDFIARPEPITIYDSTGFAGQDLAAARVFLRVLKESGYPASSSFNAPHGVGINTLLGLG